MNGIEILSTVEAVAKHTSNWWLAGFIYLGVILLTGIMSYNLADYMDKVKEAIMGCFIGALVGIIFWGITVVITDIPVSYETHYKFTINDSVLMNEFLDKYEILDQDGKIYTIREKE